MRRSSEVSHGVVAHRTQFGACCQPPSHHRQPPSHHHPVARDAIAQHLRVRLQMAHSNAAAARADAVAAQTKIDALQVQHEIAMSKVLASLSSDVETAVENETRQKVDQMKQLTQRHKRDLQQLQIQLRDTQAASHRTAAEVNNLFDAAHRAMAAAESTARDATAAASSAQADAKAAAAQRDELEAEREMLATDPSLVLICRTLGVVPSARLTDGTGTRPGQAGGEASARQEALLSLNATACVIKVCVKGGGGGVLR